MHQRVLLAFLPPCALFACGQPDANAADRAYNYELIELPAPPRSIEDPNEPYRNLRQTVRHRASAEAVAGGDFEGAFVNSTFFGEASDRVMISAITPERGVYYFLPPGPYPVDGGTMLTLRDPVSVCRMTIEFDALQGGPIISDIGMLEFPDKRCKPFEQGIAGSAQAGRATYQVSGEARDEGLIATFVRESGGGQVFDAAAGLSSLLARRHEVLARVIPLAGINEPNVAAGFSRTGEMYLVLRSHRMKDKERCVIEGARWTDLTMDVRNRLPSLCDHAKRSASNRP